LFPLKKQTIVFVSFGGNSISCNPYYIYKEIIKNSSNYTCYWIVNRAFDNTEIPESCFVKKNSFRYFLLMQTSKFIVTNDRLDNFIKFRRSQIVINTWHGGGAFKRTFGYPKGMFGWYIKKTNKNDSERTTYFVSTSEKWTETIARKSFGYYGKVLSYGYPRNDLFFDNNRDLKHAIREKLKIACDSIVVLYAPTYRGLLGKSEMQSDQFEIIDVPRVEKTVEEKYHNKAVFLYRGHRSMNYSIATDSTNNVSSYPDMQELLLISDILITDYSSCMWDFALTYNPCFIYAPDFEKYAKEPGFESDFNEWPFIITKNNDELIREINDFNIEKYKIDVQRYLHDYGSFEKGKAASMLVNKMNEL
jgi:CDP-glycerol glycerophosphotransferase